MRIALDGDRVALATLDPDTGHLLVGTANRTESEFHILHRLQRTSDRRLGLAASAEQLALAWLDASGAYHLATRPVGAPNDVWERHLIAVEDELGGLAFAGSEHFSMTFDATGALHLAFHDAERRTLRHLSAPKVTGPWVLEDIDDGLGPAAGPACNIERRQRMQRGVGWEPDTRAIGSELFVAYHDADCGDLRLAYHDGEVWSLTIVDTGELEADNLRGSDRGIVGRFPSLAFDGNGDLAIAYQDVSRSRLMFARAGTGRFERDVADGGFELDELSQKRKQIVGAFARLTIDDNGTPRIIYMNATRNHLRLTHRLMDSEGRSRWVQRSLDTRAPVGFFADALFAPGTGLVVAAERMEPGPQPGQLRSHLLLLWDS